MLNLKNEINKLKDYLKEIKNTRILVIGDTNIDQLITGTVNKISPDAPVPLVEILNDQKELGNLGIIIKEISNLGGFVDLCTLIGDDIEGQYAKQEYEKLNIGLQGIIQFNTATPKITRIIAQSYQLIRLEQRYSFSKIEEKNNDKLFLKKNLNTKVFDVVVDYISKQLPNVDAILIIDYNLGLFHPILINRIISLAKEHNKPIIVRPEQDKFQFYSNVDIIIMNRNNAAKVVGISSINETTSRIIGNRILSRVRSKNLYLSWLEEDSYLFSITTNQSEPNVKKIESLFKYPIRSFKKAGPIMVVIISLMLANGFPIDDTVELAHIMASYAVSNNYESKIEIKSLIEWLKKS